MAFYWLLLGILAVWRISHLINAEDGPWQLVARLRRFVGNGFWGDLMDCFYCVSLWVAAPFAVALARDLKEGVLLWLAISAGAILLERLIEKHAPTPALYLEEPNHETGLHIEQAASGLEEVPELSPGSETPGRVGKRPGP